MSTLYRTLRQMEKDGYLESTWEPGPTGPARRVYTITDAGHAWLDSSATMLNAYRETIDRFFGLYGAGPGATPRRASDRPDRAGEKETRAMTEGPKKRARSRGSVRGLAPALRRQRASLERGPRAGHGQPEFGGVEREAARDDARRPEVGPRQHADLPRDDERADARGHRPARRARHRARGEDRSDRRSARRDRGRRGRQLAGAGRPHRRQPAARPAGPIRAPSHGRSNGPKADRPAPPRLASARPATGAPASPRRPRTGRPSRRRSRRTPARRPGRR